MRSRFVGLCAAAALLAALSGCALFGGSAGTSSSSGTCVSDLPSSSRIGLADPNVGPGVTLTHDDSFYCDHALYYDASFLPLYLDPANLTEEEKFKFFQYFVCSEGLYNAGADFYSDKDRATCIPISNIKTVLKQFLGVDFDPEAAFGTERVEMGEGITPYGYDKKRGIYVQGEMVPWVAADRVALISQREALDDNTIRLTFDFYYTGDLDSDSETEEDGGFAAYKQKIMVFRESANVPDDYSILRNTDVYTVDHTRIEVNHDRDLDELRPYIETEPWYR